MSKSAIVVGAGIVGMATARALAEKGFSVKVFERNERAVGASIRNFGMVWPTGQPIGYLRDRAMRSREIWKEAADNAGIWNNPCGSLLNVYHDDELAVIEEFYAANNGLHDCAILTAKETLKKSPATNPNGLKAGLWSSSELIVDPREAIFKLPAYLAKKYSIEFHFGKAVREVQTGQIKTGKEMYGADLVFVCSGEDFETLFPETFAASGIVKCKLQMLRTVPQTNNWNTGPALAAGLTLTHYGAYADCPSLTKLQERYNKEYPEHVKWGIHVMISQNGLSEVTIGDSHEYGLVFDPFVRDEVNRLIMDYLDTFVQLKDVKVAQVWHGIYSKLKGATEFIASPEKDVHVINGLSGAGMTLSFGLAEEVVGKIAG